ncbi:MAG: TetR/AcrR family transcriptional regulator [Candidatus Cryptobacteroides sp.]
MSQKKTKIEQRIITAATKVFLEKGYEGTNMTLIAEAAGIRRPALYYYFKTKDKVFNELFWTQVRGLVPGFLEVLNKDISSEEKIEEFINSYFDQLLKNPFIACFLLREMYRNDKCFQMILDNLELDNYFYKVLEAYKAEVAKGNLKDVPVYAVILTMVGGVITPFIFQPVIEKSLAENMDKEVCPAEDFKTLVNMWRPYAIQYMKNLLLP